MKIIFLLRHAKSSWDHLDLYDRDRPLNKRGKCQAPTIGKSIYPENLTPDLILSSPARRVRKTAEAVAEHLSLTSNQLQTRSLAGVIIGQGRPM